MTKSQYLKKRISEVRGENKSKTDRDPSDNLIPLERSILEILSNAREPIGAKEIAVHLFGSDVTSEGKGVNSVRTVRNALRVPKSMGLLKQVDVGKYSISDDFKSCGMDFAVKMASEMKITRSGKKPVEGE